MEEARTYFGNRGDILARVESYPFIFARVKSPDAGFRVRQHGLAHQRLRYLVPGRRLRRHLYNSLLRRINDIGKGCNAPQAGTSGLRLDEVFAIFEEHFLASLRVKCDERFTVNGNSATQRRTAAKQDLPLGWTDRLVRALLDPMRHFSRW